MNFTIEKITDLQFEKKKLNFKHNGLRNLQRSIANYGIIQPIHLNKGVVFDGVKRILLTKSSMIPCLHHDDLSDFDVAIYQMILNNLSHGKGLKKQLQVIANCNNKVTLEGIAYRTSYTKTHLIKVIEAYLIPEAIDLPVAILLPLVELHKKGIFIGHLLNQYPSDILNAIKEKEHATDNSD